MTKIANLTWKRFFDQKWSYSKENQRVKRTFAKVESQSWPLDPLKREKNEKNHQFWPQMVKNTKIERRMSFYGNLLVHFGLFFFKYLQFIFVFFFFLWFFLGRDLISMFQEIVRLISKKHFIAKNSRHRKHIGFFSENTSNIRSMANFDKKVKKF